MFPASRPVHRRYLAATALVIYEKTGLALLRRAWVNLDLVWAVALMVTGCATFLV